MSASIEEVSLTKKEFEILCLLLRNPNRVFSREDILDKIWKDESYVLDRTVDVNLTRLRKKLGDYGQTIVKNAVFLHGGTISVHIAATGGLGFRFNLAKE